MLSLLLLDFESRLLLQRKTRSVNMQGHKSQTQEDHLMNMQILSAFLESTERPNYGPHRTITKRVWKTPHAQISVRPMSKLHRVKKPAARNQEAVTKEKRRADTP
jgi:hypothetical protein